MTLEPEGEPEARVRVGPPALGILAALAAIVARSPRPMPCERCGLRRILFRAELQLRAAQPGVKGPAAAGTTYLTSPAVCADCAEIRVRSEEP